jgi:mono/diheme cytochrome c family protein
MPHVLSKAIVVATLGCAAVASAEAPKAAAHDRTLDRGRYLMRIGGCNDCHTPHYPEKAGLVPESEWLTGVPVGIQGPWGTTYPANLRLAMQAWTEAQWLARARQPMRPPMPWFALRDMSDADLRAIYRYVRTLGPKGKPVPAYVPPGGSVTTPYMDWSVRSPAPPKQGQ